MGSPKWSNNIRQALWPQSPCMHWLTFQEQAVNSLSQKFWGVRSINQRRWANANTYGSMNKISGCLWMTKIYLPPPPAPPGWCSSHPSNPGLQDSIVYSCSQTVRERLYEGKLTNIKRCCTQRMCKLQPSGTQACSKHWSSQLVEDSHRDLQIWHGLLLAHSHDILSLRWSRFSLAKMLCQKAVCNFASAFNLEVKDTNEKHNQTQSKHNQSIRTKWKYDFNHPTKSHSSRPYRTPLQNHWQPLTPSSSPDPNWLKTRNKQAQQYKTQGPKPKH